MLITATPGLISNINKAMKDNLNIAKEEGADPVEVIDQLATDITEAIHKFMLKAKVTTTLTASPGQMDTVGGATAAPGSGKSSGGLS